MGSRVNTVVLRLLGTRWLPAPRRSVVGLEVRGRRTGKSYRFPVQAAHSEDGGLVVVPGRHHTKTWWRNVGRSPTACRALLEGHWVDARAVRLGPGDDGYDDALVVYRRRWPRVQLPEDQPVVVVRPRIA